MMLLALMTFQTFQTLHLRVDGPLHEIHGEMLANAMKQAAEVVVEVRGPQPASEVAQRLAHVVTASSVRVSFVDQTPTPGIRYAATIRERIVSAVLDPNVAFVVLMLGLLCIDAEFCLPGLVLPGALGGVLTILAMYGLAASKIRGTGVALMLIAAVLFVLGAFIPARGLLGLLATAALIAGAMRLIDAAPAFRIGTATAIGGSILFALITIFLTGTALRARRNKTIEQIHPVVFVASRDIFSIISGDSGLEGGHTSAQRDPAERTADDRTLNGKERNRRV